jgi:hypothetical protein
LIRTLSADIRQNLKAYTYFAKEDAITAIPNLSLAELASPINNSRICRCVQCCDSNCGHIWMASAKQSHPKLLIPFDDIQIIISHCMNDLFWTEAFFQGYNTSSIYIYSKCGKEVDGAPKDAKIFRMNNVGRNDHAYLHHIINHTYFQNASRKVLFFLKDNRKSTEERGGKWRSIQELLLIVSTFQFACAMEHNVRRQYIVRSHLGAEKFSPSAFHDKKEISAFAMGAYRSKSGLYDNSTENAEAGGESFKSKFNNLGEWLQSMSILLPPTPVVQVCYGGSFVTTVDAIQKQPLKMWKSLETSLSRADNIEEGHFMERAWAGLLSKPLNQEEVDAIQNYSTNIARKNFIRGALLHHIDSGRNIKSQTTQWETCSILKRR